MNSPAEKYFSGLNMFGIRLGLDATRELLRRAGSPEQDLRFIHLAGTNGKGSTGAMLERALRSAGLTTGFYTSPHLIYTRERFRVNGRAVSADDFDRCTAELAECAGNGEFSYFEFATVLAALIFCRAGVDVVIWETGMGGRLDATNAVLSEAAVITNIAFDHENHLGHTLAAIAGEKAGIIKPGRPVFYGFLAPEAADVIRDRAAAAGSPSLTPEPPPETARYFERNGRLLQRFDYDGESVELALPGRMQRRNFALARIVLRHFAAPWHFDLGAALKGLAEVNWPARCQRLSPRLIVDGGHNPDGIAALVEAVAEVYPGEKFTVVYGAFRDKDYQTCLRRLAGVASQFIFTPIAAEGRPSLSAAELSRIAAPLGVPCRGADCAVEAVNLALAGTPGQVLAAGSLYLAGEILQAFAPPEAVLDL